MNILSQTLLDSERAMNDDGAHWIQGAMCKVLDKRMIVEATYENPYAHAEDLTTVQIALERDPRTCGFCAVGAIRWTVFGDTDPDHATRDDPKSAPLYNNALRALIESPVVQSYYERIDTEPLPDGDYTDEMEGTVITFNDDKFLTTWKDVNKAFRQAAIRAESNWLARQLLRLRLRTY